MDIRQNKTNNTTPVFKAICDTFNTYIPAMHVRGADTFVSTTKQQKPTKETPAAQSVSVHAAGCSFNHRNYHLWPEGHERLGNL